MKERLRKLLAAVAIGLAMAMVAGSTAPGFTAQAQRISREGERIARERGYSTGRERGFDDARSRRRPDPNNSEHYRDGDSGYHSEFGSIGAYRRIYRDSFRRGYFDAFREYNRGRR